MGALFGCSFIFIIADTIKKRSKRFLPKNLKKNEFIGAKQETVEIDLDLEETTKSEKKKKLKMKLKLKKKN